MKNNILDVKDKIYQCTGCQVCAALCPQDAIKIILDNEGFYVPQIDQDKCNYCGLCKRSCYKFGVNIEMTNKVEGVQTFAAKSKNKEILNSSTSGGIASHIAEECIKQGYKVVGVAYDFDRDIAINRIASSEKDLVGFRGSKYIQSYTVDAFKKIIKDKNENKYAVFGTPCQIYALSKVVTLLKKRGKFLFIDVFCHGCPSQLLWKKYINNVKIKYGIKKLEQVEFRSKKRGWHEFCIYCKENAYEFSSKNNYDEFFLLFFDNKILCKACYECKLRSSLEYTDIRLGDFWGYEYDLDREGVSLVCICTENGGKIFGKISEFLSIKKHDFANSIINQSYGKVYMYDAAKRKKLIKLLNSGKKIDEIKKEYILMYSFKQIVKFYLKNFIYTLPVDLKYLLRKIYHKYK